MVMSSCDHLTTASVEQHTVFICDKLFSIDALIRRIVLRDLSFFRKLIVSEELSDFWFVSWFSQKFTIQCLFFVSFN